MKTMIKKKIIKTTTTIGTETAVRPSFRTHNNNNKDADVYSSILPYRTIVIYRIYELL